MHFLTGRQVANALADLDRYLQGPLQCVAMTICRIVLCSNGDMSPGESPSISILCATTILSQGRIVMDWPPVPHAIQALVNSPTEIPAGSFG